MSSLISDIEFQNIRNDIKLVTETFFTTPVTYNKYVGALDRWGENNTPKFNDISLLCLYEDSGKEIDELLAGSMSKHGVKLSFNFDDLKSLGLTDSNHNVLFNDTTDFVTVHNKKYKIKKVVYDGPLQPDCVIISIFATIIESGYGTEKFL